MSSSEQVQKFVFINKTPGKLARTENEKYIVAAHIGKTTRWTKQERPTRRPIVHTQPCFHVGKFAIEPPNESFEDHPRTSDTAEADTPQGSTSFSSNTDRQSHRRRLLLHCCTTHPQQPNFSPVCFKGNSDPFSSTSFSLSSFTWDIVQAAFRFLVFSSHPSTPAQAYRTQLGDVVSSRLPIRDNITGDVGFHAILAAGYLVKASAAVGKQEETALIEQSDKCKGRCISRISRELSTNTNLTDAAMLLRILISIEFFTGDYKAALAHFRGLKAISELNVNWWVATVDFMIMADIGISLATLSKTELDPTSYDPGPRLVQQWDQELICLNNNTQSKSLKGSDASPFMCISEETQELAVGVDEIVDTLRILTSGTKIQTRLFNSIMCWLNRRASALASRLLSDFVDGTKAAQDSRSRQMKKENTGMHALKAATSLTLLLFLSPFSMEQVSEGDFSRVWKAIEPKLRLCTDLTPGEKSGLHSDEGESKDLQDTHAWTVFLCAVNDDLFCARGHTQYSGWARMEFGRLRHDLGIGDREEARIRLSRCIWSGSILDEFLERLMREDPTIGEGQTEIRQPLFSKEEWVGLLWRHFVGMS